MKNNKIMWNDKRYSITSVVWSFLAFILLLLNWHLNQKIKIDNMTLTLFVIMFVPWLLPFLASIEIPNICIIKPREIEKAVEFKGHNT